MPFTTRRGLRIHYTVEGSGPLVVLQHGFLMDASSWKTSGFVDALTDRFQVACVDSLGHGLSDKPADTAPYSQAQRAGDIVAVIDDLGSDRAHLVGYSMGSWMSVGVAKHHAERLASLTVGGWDIVRGVASAMPGNMPVPDFDQVMAGARLMAPDLVDWVTPEVGPGLRACWAALGELDGAEAAVLALPVPVMLWNGLADPYQTPMRTFAVANGLRFLSTPGDHLGALLVHGVEGVAGICSFLDETTAALRP